MYDTFFFSKKKKRNFIHLSRSKLHSVYSLPGEFQSPKNGSNIETAKSSVKKQKSKKKPTKKLTLQTDNCLKKEHKVPLISKI